MIHATQTAVTSVTDTLTLLAAMTTFGVFGIRLVIDHPAEIYHLDARWDFNRGALQGALELIDSMGLEVVDEDECPSELLDDGTLRVWLARTW